MSAQRRFALVSCLALVIIATTMALVVGQGSETQRDASVELLKKAVIFEGSTFGFEEEKSPFRAAFESLLEERTLQPFVTLLGASAPAAKVYGARGVTATMEALEEKSSSLVNAELRRTAVGRLTELLDDDRPLELYVSCEHRPSAVGIEGFRALGQILPAKQFDAVVADIFREAVMTKAFPLKFQLASSRAETRPTMEYLGFLFLRYLNDEAGAVLLDPAPALDKTLRSDRIRAVTSALRSQHPDLRLAGIGAARDLAATEFVEDLAARLDDSDDRVAAYALRVFATNGTPFLDALVKPQWKRTLEATVAHSRSALDAASSRRQAAADFCAALANVLATHRYHADVPTSSAGHALLENLRISLPRVPERQVPTAKAIAAIDRDGQFSLALLDDESASLHPQAFLVIVRQSARTEKGRAKTIELLRARLVDVEASKKQRLYSARALGILKATDALGELRRVAQEESAPPRLAREATKAIGRIQSSSKAR